MGEPNLFPDGTAPVPNPDASEMVGRRDFYLTRGADRTLTKLSTKISLELDSKVTRSHLVRAMCRLLAHIDEELPRQCRAVNLPTRPPNGNRDAGDNYESRLAAAMSRSVRAAGPVDFPRIPEA